MKRILAAVLAAVMLVSAAVVNACAAENGDTGQCGSYEYKVTSSSDKEITITNYTGSDKNLMIPSRLDGYKVTGIGSFAFAENTKMETVNIPNTVKAIERLTFWCCTSLKEVYIPDSVTGIRQAFVQCTSLQNFHVSSGNTYYCDIDGVLCSKDKTAIYAFPSGRGGKYLVPECITRFSAECFTDCVNLEGVVVTGEITSCDTMAMFNSDKDMTDGFGGICNKDIVVYDHSGSYLHKAARTREIFMNFCPYEIGDVNGDGKVTAVDSLLVQRAALKLVKLTEEQEYRADVNLERTLDNMDAMIILRDCVGVGSKDDKPNLAAEVCKEFGIVKEPL